MKRENITPKLVVVAVAVFLLTWSWSLHRRLCMLETNLLVQARAPALKNPSAADSALARRVKVLEQGMAADPALAKRVRALEDLATTAQSLAAKVLAAGPSLGYAFVPPSDEFRWPLLPHPADQLAHGQIGSSADVEDAILLAVEEPPPDAIEALTTNGVVKPARVGAREPAWEAVQVVSPDVARPPTKSPRVLWLESMIMEIDAEIESLQITLQMRDCHPRIIELGELRERYERVLAAEPAHAKEHENNREQEDLTQQNEPRA